MSYQEVCESLTLNGLVENEGHIILGKQYDCMTRERRGQEFAVKVFLESNEKDYNKNTVPSGYKGGRILNLEFPLCLMLGSLCGGRE